MFNVYYNFMRIPPVSDFKQRIDKIIEEISKVGKDRWLKILKSCLETTGSVNANLILETYPIFKQLSQILFEKNI